MINGKKCDAEWRVTPDSHFDGSPELYSEKGFKAKESAEKLIKEVGTSDRSACVEKCETKKEVKNPLDNHPFSLPFDHSFCTEDTLKCLCVVNTGLRSTAGCQSGQRLDAAGMRIRPHHTDIGRQCLQFLFHSLFPDLDKEVRDKGILRRVQRPLRT